MNKNYYQIKVHPSIIKCLIIEIENISKLLLTYLIMKDSFKNFNKNKYIYYMKSIYVITFL